MARDPIKEDEWITALALEKYHRFSQSFPATFFSFQWMHKTESDFVGRHLSTTGGTATRGASGGEKNNGWDGLAFAFQQPFPDLVWRFDFAVLYDLNGGHLIQPAVRYKPNAEWTVETFATFMHSKDTAGIFGPLEWGDEITMRVGYQF
jgi:hypothetical protein